MNETGLSNKVGNNAPKIILTYCTWCQIKLKVSPVSSFIFLGEKKLYEHIYPLLYHMSCKFITWHGQEYISIQ